MAYITPNSTVRFHQNIPLDNTYDHTLYFSSLSEQETYFSYRNQNDPTQSRVKYQIDNYSYQRHTRDSIRVGLPIENIVNCSYMSFKNTSFENKWFYAFITNMEYVNNNTTIVYYEIDVIQTYLFDIQLNQCYIERQHTISDEIGENTIEEPVPIGDYIFTNAVEHGIHTYPMVNGIDGNYKTFSIVVAATFTGTLSGSDWVFDETAGGGLYGGCYSGVKLTSFSADSNGVSSLNSFLIAASGIPGLIDGIISIFMIPTAFLRTELDSTPSTFVTQVEKYTNWGFSDSPTYPKNKKIYTAPYTMLHIDTSDGKSADFPFEYFSTSYVEFANQGLAMPLSEIHILPRYYKGVIVNFNERMNLENYPQCSFNTDSYKAWLALNANKMAFNTAMDVVGGIGSMVSGVGSFAEGKGGQGLSSVFGGALSAISSVGNTLIENKIASTKPPHAQGQNNGVLSVSNKEFGFHYYYCRPKDEYAHMIDDFFTRYGYAIHQNAVPNLCARTRFTYIKTVDCTINANMPNEYSQKFVSIMNNGITFWNDKQHIGNYEIANEVWPG